MRAPPLRASYLPKSISHNWTWYLTYSAPFLHRSLSFAAMRGHADVVRRLLSAGADVRWSDKKGLTCLHHAVDHGHESVTRLLIGAQADVSATSRKV